MLSAMEQRNLNLADRRLNTDNLAIMLTYQCQMACRYCFLDRRCPDMSEGVIKRSIDLLFTSPSQEVELQFFGGEPLLRFDLIKKAIAYAQNKSKQLNKTVKYLITTNGLLLDEKKLEYLKRHNVYFLLSIDGQMLTQSINRPLLHHKKQKYPFDTILRALHLLSQKQFDFFVNMVIGPPNINTFIQDVFFLFKEGVKNVFCKSKKAVYFV